MQTSSPRHGRHTATPSRPPVPGRRRALAAFTTAAMLATGASVAIAEVTQPNPTQLAALGPISGEHGYPTWYEDSTGLRLQQCLDIEDPHCDPAFLRGEMPDPDSPVSFPDNWPLESFYYLAGASIDMPGGGIAVLTSGLEATMANEATRDGDQVVFGRQRFDIDFPGPGTYVVTHPYGEDTFTVDSTDFDDFRYVEDITPAPGNFGLALQSRINPFLVPTSGLVQTERGTYVGDPGTPTTVTGSPYGTNEFRIERVLDGGAKVLVGSTDLFTLMGKVSTNSGIRPDRATLVESADARYLDVFASTDEAKAVTVSGPGLPLTDLDAEGERYFARIPLGATTPTTVTVSNVSDDPVASRPLQVTDAVTITSATYDTGSDQLTVTATSTDEVEPPTLTLTGLGADVALVGGTATVTTTAPPASVSVVSGGGGEDTATVVVDGGAAGDRAVTLAAISGPVRSVIGDAVTLRSASLNAESLQWEQTGGTDVGITGSTTDQVTFTPDEGGAVTVQLTATGASGETSTTAPFTVEVLTERPPAEAPVAVATATPGSALVGQTVTVSGADSQNAASHAWSQTTGTGVTFDPDAPTFSFPMPVSSAPLTFELTVTNTDGVSATTTVSLGQITDVIDVTQVQYRADKGEWKIAGTASVTSVNSVKVYLANADGSRGAVLVGESVVSAPVTTGAAGDWNVRVKGGANPGTATQVFVQSTRGGSALATIQRR